MLTKKRLSISVIFMVLVLTMVPSAEAWTWKTHADVAEAVYYGLPSDVQKNLNLEIMRNASNEPDEVFKDYRHHSYPKSYEKAKSWLDKGKIAYDRGDYLEASFDYGVASHYISDTFSAPHGVSKEDSSDHTRYENRAKKLTPVATNTSGDLNSLMQNGYNQDGISWNQWLETGDTAIIQSNLNDGASVALFAINDSINGTSSHDMWSTIIESIKNYVFKIGSSQDG